MITIYDSITARPGSTLQDAMNDLATMWNWHRIDYASNSTDVEKLWVSERVYIDGTHSKFYFGNDFYNYVLNEFGSTNYERYWIVKTDKAIFFNADSSQNYFAVSKTVSTDGTESEGIAISNGNYLYLFTDNMMNANSNSIYLAYNSSSVHIQLMPIYSHIGTDHFEDLYRVVMKKSTDTGKLILDNEHYYVENSFALPYTAS